jgi:NRAMP (natural resistance-associated macrophage protein)-like metal ion transporter
VVDFQRLRSRTRRAIARPPAAKTPAAKTPAAKTPAPRPPAAKTPEAEDNRRRGHLLKILGPGLITGAADDDPSGIATYSQTGAQFGYGQLWTALWMLPLVTGVQEACGRIGNVTRQGLAHNIKQRYSVHTLQVLLALLTVANIINIGADIGAMGASAALIIPIPAPVLMVIFTFLILGLEIRVSYTRYAKVLKWLTLSLLAYPVTAMLMHEPWGAILRATFVPHIRFSAGFAYVITAVIGTTITPYMFFWQTSQEVEDNEGRAASRPLRDMRTDNAVGMFCSQATMWFIIITAGTALHAAHVGAINSAADAARALEPLVRSFPHAGEVARGLFAVGIVSLGLLAVPVMAGATSYALSEARSKREGLELKPRDGRYFYGVIIVAVLGGLCLNFTGVNPIKALVFAAVFNGIAAIPLLVFIDRIAARQDVMGEARSGWLSRTVLAVTIIGMTGSVVALALSYL